MEASADHRQRVLGSFRRLWRAGLSIVQNRLELFLVEVQEERLQFFTALLLSGIVLALGSLTILVLTGVVLVLCLRSNRVDLLLGLAGVYALGTVAAYLCLRRQLRVWNPFASSLAELRKDVACSDEKNSLDSSSKSRP